MRGALLSSLTVAALPHATACTSDEGSGDDAGSTMGSGADTSGTGQVGEEGGTACEPDPGEFEPLLDWSAPPGLVFPGSFVAVHAVHMPPAPPANVGALRDPETARIFVMGGLYDQHFWNPADNTFEYWPLPMTENADLFCAGHSITPEGNAFIVGGGGGSASDAIVRAYKLTRTPSGNGDWERLADMQHERWYPSAVTLDDGRVFVLGGEGTGADIPEIYDPGTDSWEVLEASPGTAAQYPLLFLLPDGNIFYAGSELANPAPDGPNEGFYIGRVMDMNANTPTWLEAEFPSRIRGGSAVMYEPGRIMKSGGGGNPQATTEWIDMTGDYTGGRSWQSLAENAGDMSTPRHFHTLTLLPDGRVAATGGNWYGSWAPGDNADQPCEVGNPPQPINEMLCDSHDDCPTIDKSCRTSETCSPGTPGPTCDATGCTAGLCRPKECSYTEEPCAGDADCPDAGYCMDTPAFDHDGDPETPKENVCWPGKNECFGTRTAEVWDPETKLWSPCPEATHATEDVPRMYHSNAILLRDATVLSTGGGSSGPLIDQASAQVFVPPYGAGVVPEISLGAQTTSYGSDLLVELGNAAQTSIARVTLLRLGSATHGFNMEQRFIDLTPTMVPIGTDVMVTLPTSANDVPPGWYLVFALDPSGAPSQGEYLQITDDTTVSWICGPGPGLTAREYGCLPSAGPTCSGASSWTTVPLPSLGGTQTGWRVHTPPGMIANPATPTPAEVTAVRQLCATACALEWQNEPGVVATCSAGNAFAAPVAQASTTSPTSVAMIPSGQEMGSGLWPGTSLTCNLEESCCAAFDENVCASTPARPTPAATPLARGQAYAVPWSTTTSKLRLITNMGTWTRSLSGSAGHSPCRDGNATAACPFYLGSLVANTTGSLTPSAQCSDGTTAAAIVSSVQFELEQPAFGVARAASTERGFPPGALVLKTTATINGETVVRRQPNSFNVKGTQSSPTLLALTLDVPLTVPCNSGTTELTARIDLGSSGATGSPPTGTITVPSQVTCGTSRALTYTQSDPNNDIVSRRWLVDGTLLAPSVTSVVFTGTHTLALRVRDARGATTTTTKVISCL
jgi:hypothetical protein